MSTFPCDTELLEQALVDWPGLSGLHPSLRVPSPFSPSSFTGVTPPSISHLAVQTPSLHQLPAKPKEPRLLKSFGKNQYKNFRTKEPFFC